jgi:snRNA-activating protein complex subunit 3
MAAAGEEAESSAASGERPRVPFARGGPVFVPFMVGPISTVPEFLSSTLREVQVPAPPPLPIFDSLRFSE